MWPSWQVLPVGSPVPAGCSLETGGGLPHLLFDFGSKCDGSYSIVDLEVFVSSLEFGHSEVKSVSPSCRSVTALLHESGVTSEVQSRAVASACSALV